MLTGGVDLLRSFGSLEIKMLSIYKALIDPELKHDLNSPVGMEVLEQLVYTNWIRPF